jgi:hypothetical protein
MKKLLNETTDDLTRALLVAGIEHRPPAGNQGKLIMALGAGGAVGLFSSNAVAWLGTTAGKASLLGVALGVAGAVYAVVPWSGTGVRDGDVSALHASLPAHGNVGASRTPPVAAPDGVDPSASGSSTGPGKTAPGDAEPNGAQPGVVGSPGDDVSRTDSLDERAPAAPTPQGRARARRERDRVSPITSEPRRDGPQPAVSAPPAVGALSETLNRESSLDSEVRLVDEMHWAARHNDREALSRFVETYRLNFPDGQLRKEVSEFAARLERPATR